jgi:putative membrane protein
MTLNAVLAALDAALTSVSLVCLLAGVRAIRRKDVQRHRRLMVTAFAGSAAFMILFVVRFATFGFGEFQGTGVVRGVYVAVSMSHEPLGVINVPLAIATLVTGLTRRYAIHRDLAKMTYPLWLYVATTGVAIYVLLWLC